MNSITPDLVPYDNPPPNIRVRALFCADHKGQVQVVAPEGALVDPEPIRESTARDLRSLPSPAESSICAIPGFYGLPSVVHADLKGEAIVALATEVPGEYVRASGTQIHQMCLDHASFETQFCDDLILTPASSEDDEQNIYRAVETFTSRRIEARLDETMVIPPLPETAERIIDTQQDPNFDLMDIVSIIEADPAIAARIMGWANSAFYGTATPSKTLNDAIMRVLGFDLVFNMALGMSIGATLNLPSSHVSGASPYWLDSVYTAATMEALARQIPKAQRPDPASCYLAGLLSNFGTLVLGHVFPPQYETICRLQEANPQLPYACVDQHVMMINREVIAATLFELWDLPDEITTAVRFQNVENYSGSEQSYVKLLALASDLLAHGPSNITENSVASMEMLNLSRDGLDDVDEVISASREELGDLASSMGR